MTASAAPRVGARARGTSRQQGTYQKNLNGPQNIHGPCEGCAQIEAEAHGAPKLRPQGPRNHVVRAASCRNHHTGNSGSGPGTVNADFTSRRPSLGVVTEEGRGEQQSVAGGKEPETCARKSAHLVVRPTPILLTSPRKAREPRLLRHLTCLYHPHRALDSHARVCP